MIDPSHPHAKLPDKATLERLYVRDNLSFKEIGDRYGVTAKVVYNNMKRRADKAGTAWPLKTQRPDWRARAAKKHSEVRWDAVTTVMLRAEIRECREVHGVTNHRIAELAGLHPSQVDQIAAPKGRPRVSRTTAERLMRGIVEVERRSRQRNAALALAAQRRGRA